MEAEDPLSQLRDIHLPDAVAFWPPAAGWWVLLALVLTGLVFLYRHAIAALIRRRKLAAVLHELDAAHERYSEQAAFDQHADQAKLDFLFDINTLLKRVALVKYPAQAPGELSGRAWLEFLDRVDGTTRFSQGAGTALADGIYRRRVDVDVDALQALARGWIENRYLDKPAPARSPAQAGGAAA